MPDSFNFVLLPLAHIAYSSLRTVRPFEPQCEPTIRSLEARIRGLQIYNLADSFWGEPSVAVLASPYFLTFLTTPGYTFNRAVIFTYTPLP